MKKRGFRIFARKHPLTAVCVVSVSMGILLSAAGVFITAITTRTPIRSFGEFVAEFFMLGTMFGVALGVFVLLPAILTLIQIISLWWEVKGKEYLSEMRHLDLVTIGLGVLYNILVLSMLDAVSFDSDWTVALYNTQKHTPIFTETYPTIWGIIAVAVLGYMIVHFIPLKKMPPLVFVLGLSTMYLGTGLSIFWFVQVFKGRVLLEACLFLLPICCLCITARTVITKVKEWNRMKNLAEEDATEENDERGKTKVFEGKGTILHRCNQFLSDSRYWPVAAFLLMWPLLGILIGILVLFGQKPDAIIKAWTETSDWNLSQRVAPQNLYMDEHYLCTVAADGHKEIVKPIRLGVRHGHEVIVNRQLCVANAFEQVLEEKTPRFHKTVRGFYDKYGFPIGKLIMKSKVAADITYFIMKPLEWIFLMVLYLVDVNPENRIAVQYTGKTIHDFHL